MAVASDICIYIYNMYMYIYMYTQAHIMKGAERMFTGRVMPYSHPQLGLELS